MFEIVKGHVIRPYAKIHSSNSLLTYSHCCHFTISCNCFFFVVRTNLTPLIIATNTFPPNIFSCSLARLLRASGLPKKCIIIQNHQTSNAQQSSGELAALLHRCGCAADALRFCRALASAMCSARQRHITFRAAQRKSLTTIMHGLSMCGWMSGASSSTASIQVPRSNIRWHLVYV